MPDIIIKLLRRYDEMHAAVEVQKAHWGEGDSLVPAHMLFSIAEHGGHVLAAMDGSHIIGVLIGFIGTSEDNETRPAMANLQIVSKRMVVLPEYRGHSVGFRLKLAQRDLAIKQGIRLATWTFDPLLAANAHLNVRKLGVVCNSYLVDYYGVDESPGIVLQGSSDRLLAEWWVTQRRVDERISGQRPPLSLQHYLDAGTPIVNPSEAGSFATPTQSLVAPGGALALVEIPSDIGNMRDTAPELARAWREHLRTVILQRFAGGDSITDFVRGTHEGRDRAFFVLSVGAGTGERYRLN